MSGDGHTPQGTPTAPPPPSTGHGPTTANASIAHARPSHMRREDHADRTPLLEFRGRKRSDEVVPAAVTQTRKASLISTSNSPPSGWWKM